MEIVRTICNHCGGAGRITRFEIVDSDGRIGTLRGKESVCDNCNGEGSIESHAVFSVEEAKAILKHCGLSTES